MRLREHNATMVFFLSKDSNLRKVNVVQEEVKYVPVSAIVTVTAHSVRRRSIA